MASHPDPAGNAQPDLLAGVDKRARRIKPLRRPPPDKGLLICGVDEAGRGPLAGPVYAAAVVLNPAKPIRGLDDSKKLTALRREKLAVRIQTDALAFGVASASVEEIDTINILQATLLAMRRAVEKLLVRPDEVWVDGTHAPVLPYLTRAIIKGDAQVPSISAASILAKSARDRELVELARAYPEYAFERHKGYATQLHLARIRELGACPAHRRSFAPVRHITGALL
ncbi:MAG: ribonuclease HII [Burkholderiales bacterium]|nr:ribonuclease HII [Burkholderiales bacterium]